MNEVKVEKCPNCGGILEEGALLCPRTLAWRGQKWEQIVGFHWSNKKLQGWKCEKCQLIIFLYGKGKVENHE